MWLAVMPFALLLSIAFLAFQIGPGIEYFARLRDMGGALEMIFLFAAVVPTALCYGGVLLLSILLWPLKVFSGWRAGWSDDVDRSVRKVPISHLMMWVGLWGALFLLTTTLAEGFGAGTLAAGFLGLLLILVSGFPVAHLLSGDRWTVLQLAVVAAFILLLSFVESGLIYGFALISRALVIVLAFNASLAGVIALNCVLMSRRGLRLHMPLPWWRGKPPSPSFAGKTFNS
jgi:hypothetical protein